MHVLHSSPVFMYYSGQRIIYLCYMRALRSCLHNNFLLFCDINIAKRIFQEEHLKKIPDISRLSKRIQRQKAGLQVITSLHSSSFEFPCLPSVLRTRLKNDALRCIVVTLV